MHRLLDMGVVIRSKDAGINRLTFDIIFTSGENYEPRCVQTSSARTASQKF